MLESSVPLFKALVLAHASVLFAAVLRILLNRPEPGQLLTDLQWGCETADRAPPAPSLLHSSPNPAPSFLSTPTFLLSPCLFSAAECFHVHTSVSEPHLLRRAATMIISFNRWGPNVLSHLIDGKTETYINASLVQGDTKSEQGLGLDWFWTCRSNSCLRF